MKAAVFKVFLPQLCLSACASAATGHVGQPTLYQSPRFRWWWPGGWVDADEVGAEISEIVDAGFGGGEIGDVQDSIKVDLDPEIYGWGQARWNAAVLTAIGGHVDQTLGPHWPTGYPGLSPDDPSTSKELVHGQVFVSAGETYQGDLPLPVAAPSGNTTGNVLPSTPKAYLAAVIAAQTSTTNQNASVVTIDPSTVQVLTDLVAENSTTISWTAPSNGSWVLVAAYGRGTGQIQNMYDGNTQAPKVTYPFPAYIVDHFSVAGVEAGVKYWTENLLSDELLPLLAQANGSFFEDSLELKLKQYWTLNFLEEFQERRGYDLSPFLFYVIKDTNTFTGDDSVATQIVNDFYQTVSDLYTEYRLGGLKTWANSIGMKLRVQPYTLSADSVYAASVVDIPEGESLGFEGDNDAFRALATGRDVGGKTTILSDELGAYMGLAYGVEWSFILGTANLDMALGVSQVVIHGFPYRDSPDSLWPGFAPFTPLGTNSNGFADAWGPRQPHWIFARNASAYLAYAQKLLQDGGPSIDVAILNEAWGVSATWSDTSLNDAGYSYQFPTAKLLAAYNVTVEDGRLAAPAYKALVVDQTAVDVSHAQAILSYGESGLPIVLVGSSAPNSTFTYSATLSSEDAVEELSQLWSQIQALNTTQVASSSSEVPDVLAALGVQPSVQYPSNANTSLITLRRTLDSGFFYWIYNDADDTVENTISLEGTGAPYHINLWTGDVTPIPAFVVSGDYITFNISLTTTAALAVYVGPTNPFDAPVLATHLVSSTCDTFVRDGTIYLQSSSSGTTCEATTSNATVVTLSTAASALPSPVTPSSWTLRVEDWSPAVANESGLNSSQTTKTALPPVTLTTLASWPNITALDDVAASGIGVYNTSVSLSAAASDDVRVYLSVGTVVGSYAVAVNGKSVGSVDWLGGTDIDVTDLVVSGSNDIQVTVATTLWNKLIKVWPAVYGSYDPQDIGLLGPVSIYYSSVQAVV